MIGMERAETPLYAEPTIFSSLINALPPPPQATTHSMLPTSARNYGLGTP